MAARRPSERNVRAVADETTPARSLGAEPGPMLKSVDRAEAAEEAAAALRVEVEDLTDLGERLRARVVAAEREALLLSEHLTTRSAMAGELRAEALLSRRERDAARRELDAAHGELVAVRRETESAVRERDDLHERLALLRTKLDGRLAELADTRMTKARLESDLEATQAAVRDLEQRVDQIDDLRDQLDAAFASNQALSGELETLVAATTAVSVQLDDSRDEVNRLEAELAAAPTAAEMALLEAEHVQREGELQAQTARLEEALAESQSTLAERDGLLGGQAEVLANRTEELANRMEELAELAELVAATEQTRDRYAQLVKATAPTTLGRLAHRWQRFSERRPGTARLMRAPFDVTWRLLTLRWPGWLRQHPLFDEDYYREANRDIDGVRLRPWWHYVRHGASEGRQPNRYFDRSWYLRTYPDVEVAGFDPLDRLLPARLLGGS